MQYAWTNENVTMSCAVVHNYMHWLNGIRRLCIASTVWSEFTVVHETFWTSVRSVRTHDTHIVRYYVEPIAHFCYSSVGERRIKKAHIDRALNICYENRNATLFSLFFYSFFYASSSIYKFCTNVFNALHMHTCNIYFNLWMRLTLSLSVGHLYGSNEFSSATEKW